MRVCVYSVIKVASENDVDGKMLVILKTSLTMLTVNAKRVLISKCFPRNWFE